MECGYKLRFSREPEFNIQIRMLPALAFLPLEDIEEAFDEMEESEDNVIPVEILTYFETTYIG